MTDNSLAVQELYMHTMQIIEEAKKDVNSAGIDLTLMGRCVEAYCNAVASLPKEEGQQHEENLKTLMQAINELSGALVQERDAVYQEIQSLENVKRAHNAYQKTRAIKGVFDPSQGEQ